VAQTAAPAEQHPLKTTIGLGYMAGGQVYNDSFLYNPGFKFDAATHYTVSPAVLLGVGSGLMSFTQQERFIPLYASFVGFTKPGTSGTYFLAKAGYSYGWDTDYAAFPDYEFNGGALINVGLGHRFLIHKNSLLFSLVYGHQFAGASYQTPEGKEFSERLNFDWLALEFMFMF
jgi:hypothetical protein